MRLLPQTIRGEFALFAVSLALPLIALIGYGLYDRARDEFTAAESFALRLAESSSERVAEYVSNVRLALEAVARRPLVRAMDAARCDPQLEDLVSLYPRAVSFTVIDRKSAVICSSRPLPRDRVIRVADEELQREMRADPRFRITKLVIGQISGRWAFGLVQPVLGENGALVGTVAAGIAPQEWNPFPPPEALSAGAIVTVLTGDGTIVARSVDAEKWIGRKVWDQRIMKRIVERNEGVVHAMGADGVDRVFGIKAVAGMPWLVLAGLPTESVFAPARKRLMQTGVFLVLIVGIVTALAWGLVTRLSKPIRAIAEAVGARAAGSAEAAIPVAGPIEVVHVARELNRMVAIQREQASADRRLKLELEAANRQLRESEARLNFALHKSHIGGWELDLVSHGAHRTLEHDRIFGYSSLLPQWTYEMFLGHVLPEDRAEVDRRFRAATAAQAEWGFECRIRRVDGEVRWIWATGEHQRDETGQARRIAGIVQDITERKRAEQEILDLNASLERRVAERTAQLEAANKELEAFSYSVSHDLRAPLRAIDGFSRIVQEDCAGKLDAEGLRLLGVIRDNSRKMARLIDDLLEYSRFGRKSLSSAVIDMRSLVEKVLEELQVPGGSSPRLEVGALPLARGDATLLKQAWANLLANAIKFSGRREQPLIEVSGHAGDAECVYCVKDNGAGFDMRYYEKLFKVFQRLHREQEFEGTGVGLAIVQRVVSRHGGRVWAEGEVDGGAAFYFSLPKGGGDGQI